MSLRVRKSIAKPSLGKLRKKRRTNRQQRWQCCFQVERRAHGTWSGGGAGRRRARGAACRAPCAAEAARMPLPATWRWRRRERAHGACNISTFLVNVRAPQMNAETVHIPVSTSTCTKYEFEPNAPASALPRDASYRRRMAAMSAARAWKPRTSEAVGAQSVQTNAAGRAGSCGPRAASSEQSAREWSAVQVPRENIQLQNCGATKLRIFNSCTVH